MNAALAAAATGAVPAASAWPDGALRSPTTGRPLRADTPHSLSDGAGERWPVVDGIPFLRIGREIRRDSALAALDRGDRAAALVALLADQDDWARTPPPDDVALADLLAKADTLSFREGMDRLALGGVALYFAHRWSDPTFLAGLALLEAHWTAPRRSFEIACGAGHYLRELRRAGVDAAGGDVVFAKLWLARHYVAPEARLVCFDAAAPWPVADGTADLVHCHDALYFLPRKPHVAAEMARIAGHGGAILVSHAHNREADNYSSGDPLDVPGYAALFAAPVVLYDDTELTRALVEARAPQPQDADALRDTQALTLAVGSAAAMTPRPVTGGLAMPAAGTRLRRNPLYEAGSVRWPSPRYEAEYAPLATYPLATDAPETAVAGRDAGTDAAIRRRVFIDLPERW